MPQLNRSRHRAANVAVSWLDGLLAESIAVVRANRASAEDRRAAAATGRRALANPRGSKETEPMLRRGWHEEVMHSCCGNCPRVRAAVLELNGGSARRLRRK